MEQPKPVRARHVWTRLKHVRSGWRLLVPLMTSKSMTLQIEVDGEQIRITGEVNDQKKRDFLAGATALLFPMIEAMACGTPVIAFRSGSVPEVIENGVSGFIVETEQTAVQAVKRLSALDPREVRRSFERRLTARRMADDYVRHYRQLMDI